MFYFAADQTPTPTRLIRNCVKELEEVGLFDDLKHVNPFEETFRQAIDSDIKRPSVLLNTQKSLEVIKSNDEDTLHTPNIIPYNHATIAGDSHKDIANKGDVIKKVDKELDDDKLAATVTMPVLIANQAIETVAIAKHDTHLPNNSNDGQDANTHKKNKIKNTKQSQITKPSKDIAQKLMLRKICPKPIAVASVNPIKEKIRESLLKLRTAQTTETDIVEAKIVFVNEDIPAFVLPSEQPQIRDNPKHEMKKQAAAKAIKTVQDHGANERNREAAKRYRHKQKILYDNLLQRNAQLQTENDLLKRQLEHFKAAHANCSVTQIYDSVFCNND